MPLIGFHASHEQFPPSELLACVQAAEQAGFAGAMCSDHYFPWSERQGQSGFAWSWLGAALQATALPFGVFNAPGERYHPAIIAQAAATLAEMFPDRFWIAVGSGQLLNEHITGNTWLPKAERNARLKECVDVMRALWAGEMVTHHGLVTVEEAKLYTRPATPPKIIGGALTPETAGWVGGWADGWITASQPLDTLRQLVEAFRAGGGANKPMYLQVKISYARSEDEALRAAHDQWGTNVFPSAVLSDLRVPSQFDKAATFVRPEDMYNHVQISASPERHVEWLREVLDLGFDHLYLHNVGRNQREFIEVFGERVLPELMK